MKEVEMEGGEREQWWCCCDGQVKADREMDEQMLICMAFKHWAHVSVSGSVLRNISVQLKNGICIRSLAWKQTRAFSNLVFLSQNGGFA